MDFDLSEIPNKKYFSIKEVSKILDIETHTIRYWEKEFAKYFSIKADLFNPEGQGYFQPDVLEVVVPVV